MSYVIILLLCWIQKPDRKITHSGCDVPGKLFKHYLSVSGNCAFGGFVPLLPTDNVVRIEFTCPLTSRFQITFAALLQYTVLQCSLTYQLSKRGDFGGAQNGPAHYQMPNFLSGREGGGRRSTFQLLMLSANSAKIPNYLCPGGGGGGGR